MKLKKKRFYETLNRAFKNNWRRAVRLIAIVIISTIIGYVLKDLTFGRFFSSVNEQTYMSYYYNYYTTKYQKPKKGENWGERKFKKHGIYEANEDSIIIIHPGYYWKDKMSVLLSEIMSQDPAVIGLDIIYDGLDSLEVDSVCFSLKEICGEKIVIAAENKNNSLSTSYFYDKDSSDVTLGSIRTQSIGLFKKNEIIKKDTVLCFPYQLAKKYCDYHKKELNCERMVVNYRKLTLFPINLDSVRENDIRYKLKSEDLKDKVVIVGTVNIDVDKVIIPCELPNWTTPDGFQLQMNHTLGTAMSGVFNHAYAVRSLIHPEFSFSLAKGNVIWNVLIIAIYGLLYLLFLYLQKQQKQKQIIIGEIGVKLMGQVFFVVFVIVICLLPFILTNLYNRVFDISLALFSILFIRIADSIYVLLKCLLNKWIKW